MNPVGLSSAGFALLAALITPSTAPVSVDLKRPGTGPVTVLSVIQGGEALEWAGTRMAGGDINGDGIADLVVAAPGGTDDRPSRRGRLYVVFGGVAAPKPLVDLKLRRRAGSAPGSQPEPISDADIVINGADDFDHLGRAVAVADLDADGFADIIVGSPRADGPGNSRPDCGEVHVIHGAASLSRTIDLGRVIPDPAAGLRVSVMYGRAPGDGFGSVIQTGDVTGDGLVDLLISSPLADLLPGPLGALDAGEMILIPARGPAAPFPQMLDLANIPAGSGISVLRGADAGDQAGSSVAIGDFDGDTASDIAIGARGGDGPGNQRPDSGEVYLIFGPVVLPPVVALGVDSTLLIAAPDIGDLAGGSLAMGDIDADGRFDLVIGAEFADGRANGRLDAGELHVVAGRSRAEVELLRPPPPANAGRTSAPLATPPPPGPVWIDLALSSIPGHWVFHGADPGDHTGIRAVADLDDDGHFDLVIGAEDGASKRNSRAGGGEIRILAGRKPMPGAMVLDGSEGVSIFGPVGGAHLGGAVALVDLNGDSRPELVVSAPQAGVALSGRTWVLSAAWRDLLKQTARR